VDGLITSEDDDMSILAEKLDIETRKLTEAEENGQISHD
jgi:hypothetical protein